MVTTLHFIWWGPFRDGDCETTPNAMASAVGTHNIIYWCKAEHADAFRAKLHANIEVKSCDSLTRIFEGAPPSWSDLAERCLADLATARAFSAVKDLLAMIILLKHGGLYLDTTCLLCPPPLGMKYGGSLQVTANTLKDFLDAPPGDIQYPFFGDMMYHMPFMMTAQAIVLGSDWEAAHDSSEQVDLELFEALAMKVPHVDVWAVYSPPGNGALTIAIESYLSRCVRMGLDGTDQPKNFSNSKGTEVLSAPSRGRDDLIGSLIIRAVLDGLIAYIDSRDGNLILPYCLKLDTLTEDEQAANQGGVHVVPELGIIKRYSGSWRNTTA